MERIDGFIDAVTRLKRKVVSFVARRELDRKTLTDLYKQSAIAARHCDRLADDATRAGFSITPEPPSGFLRRLHDELEPLQVLAQATRWSRLYGGAVVYIPLGDGGEPNQRLNLAQLRDISKPSVHIAHDVVPLTYDKRVSSRTYGQVLTFQLTLADTTQDIDATRMIVLEPVPLPLRERLEQAGLSSNGWGPSTLARIEEQLSRAGAVNAYAAAIMHMASILVLRLSGLKATLRAQGGEQELQRQTGALRKCLDMLGILPLDPDDDLVSVSHSWQGIHQLIDQFRAALGDVLDMPREIAFNESPAGLNAGQLSGPQEIWYAHVSAYQQDVLTPALRRIIDLAATAWSSSLGVYEVTWNPLFTESRESLAAPAAILLSVLQAMAAGELTSPQARALLEVAFPHVDAEALVGVQDLEVEAQEARDALPEDAVDLREAARLLGMSTATLTAAVRRGELEVFQVGGRRSVSRAAVMALARGEQATAE